MTRLTTKEYEVISDVENADGWEPGEFERLVCAEMYGGGCFESAVFSVIRGRDGVQPKNIEKVLDVLQKHGHVTE